MIRVLITGSRTWHDTHAVFQALDDLLEEHPEGLVVVHGAHWEGADDIAQRWALRSLRAGLPVTADPWPAKWKIHGKSAGPIRNAEMVGAGADECLVFAMPCTDPYCRKSRPHDTHGTANCADLAKRAGIPVKVTRGT
jgi:hypothetical protein